MVRLRDPEARRFAILVLIVSISGLSQGMLLPLISIIFEKDGVNASLNGLNATGLYIGTLLITPFMEKPLRKFGYKPIIIAGGLLVITSLFLFPLWKSALFWYVLRIVIGIGDHALHFSTQTWITSFSPSDRLGKNISFYGLSFSLGFAIGPLLVPLVNIFEGLPFIVSGALVIAAWSAVFFLRNELPEAVSSTQREGGMSSLFRASLACAWAAFFSPFAYGFLESSLNAIFPVSALRNGFSAGMVSASLVAFSIGGILTQLPLGALSDKVGRQRLIVSLMLCGSIAFLAAGLLIHLPLAVLISFFIAGCFVGSTYSLGMAYMADLTPKELLPTGNLLSGVFFSLGSLSGPFLGGWFLDAVHGVGYPTIVAAMLAVMAGLTALKRRAQTTE